MTTLLVPDLVRGHGTGHLRRCLRLMAALPEASILIPTEGSSAARGRSDLADLLEGVDSKRIVTDCAVQPSKVVLDLFDASKATVLGYGAAITIGVDIGGEGRNYCSYLVDTLPRLDEGTANVTNPAYLDVPRESPVRDSAVGRILVSYGGEDAAGLTEATARILVRYLGIDPLRVTVVPPALRAISTLPAGVRIVEPSSSLWGAMEDFEWVICSYGLTAFEAAAAGRSVATVAPTKYHDRLAARVGFARAGIRQPVGRRLRTVMSDKLNARRVTDLMRDIQPIKISDLIESINTVRVGCPVHGTSRGRAVWRSDEKSYFRCPLCGIVYLERFRQDEEEYGASYFTEEYRAQYGKSYLDDFDSIKAAGHRRLKCIRSVKSGTTSLLDIGCAFGPFMQAAAESGLHPYGIDVSSEAINYVTGTLNLPAVTTSVLDMDPKLIFGRHQFDVVTLWYVIEHFANLDALLSRVSRWLRPGGVLAIATPNIRGVSGRRTSAAFFAHSPRDHYTIWSTVSARNLLNEYGFRIRRTVSTGHHPERYPAVDRGVVPLGVAKMHSRMLGWGDTFELYAERTAQGGPPFE